MGYLFQRKKSGKVLSLAMAGASPKALKAEAMTPESLNMGINAGIVPGNFGGYLKALERYCTMSLADTLAAAIDYAENGYPIDPSLATAIARALASRYPAVKIEPAERPVAAADSIARLTAPLRTSGSSITVRGTYALVGR